MAKNADILAAMAQLEEDSGELTKKPNVDAIASLVGEPVSAQERDAAWSEFLAGKAGDDTAGDADQAPTDTAGDGQMLNNHMRNAMVVGTITIPPGGSAEVEDFDPEKPVYRAWLEAGLISLD